ncbi:MAG: cell division protein [Amoebophilaceae bacterium]|nr:cell division protein [Amoebophilaceae bacterium]
MQFTKEILLRSRLVLLAVVLVMTLIIGKIINLQFITGDQWRHAAKVSQLTYKPISASRGNIYADDGSLLATSLPFYTVILDPTVASKELFNKSIDELSQKLASFFGDHPDIHYKTRIIHARNQKRKFLVLNKRTINQKQKEKMQQWPIFKQGKYKGGVIFQKEYKRYNPFAVLAKRTIGLYRETNGSGLEYAFNKELKGIDGQALYQKVVGGNWKQVQEAPIINPVHGYDLETTIDINLQDITESSLLEVLEKTSAQHGCAIVMEVASGAIKAIANLSRTPSGRYIEAYNYAVGNQGCVEPGSIFKLVSMLALLEETRWPLTKPIDTGNGSITFFGRSIRDVKKGGYGLLTLQEVFENSSNVGITMAIQETFGANPQKFIDYIEQLGMHHPLGIELVGEGKPYIVTPKSKMWNKVSLPSLSMGYSLQVTPLQLLTICNAIANGGKMVKPMLVRHLKSANGIIKSFPTTVLKEKICSHETLGKLKLMLEGSIERGTARKLNDGFYKIAGKTGTAEKLVDGSYSDHHLTSFIGYFPAERPRYSCIIVVDDPQGKQYHFGSEVSAPIFKNIVDRVAGKDLEARNVPHATPGQPMQPQTPPLDQVEPGQLIPDVLHKTLRDALFLLESIGLEVTIKGNMHGTVCQQSLKPQTAIPTENPKIMIQLR